MKVTPEPMSPQRRLPRNLRERVLTQSLFELH